MHFFPILTPATMCRRPIIREIMMSIRTWGVPIPPAIPEQVDGMVMVCDEDPIARSLTCTALAAPGRTIKPLSSPQELLDYPLPDAPACLILETHYATVHGLELQERLRARGRHPQMVFLTHCTDVTTVVHAIHAGAVDYLTKPTPHVRLQRAAATALALDSWRRKHDQRSETTLKLVRTLTPRERQVMDCVARGQLNKQIAHELTISEVTVKMHRGQVMKKMGVRSVAALVTMLDSMPTDWRGMQIPTQMPTVRAAMPPSFERYLGLAS